MIVSEIKKSRLTGLPVRFIGLTAALSLSISAALAQHYSVTDLGTLGDWSAATGINNSGQVVGWSQLSGGYARHGFLWTSGTGITDIGTFGPPGNSRGDAINDRGQIVGFAANSTAEHAFLQNPGGSKQDLGDLGFFFSYAHGINQSGSMVVGESTRADLNIDAFVWTAAGGMQDIGTLPGSGGSVASAVNDAGMVVGGTLEDGVGGPPPEKGFVWTAAGGMLNVGAVRPGDSVDVSSLNEVGQVAGTSVSVHQANIFIWTAAGGLKDLGVVSQFGGFAGAINNHGVVVGNFDTTGNPDNSGLHALYWSASAGIRDLNSMIAPNSGWLLNDATGINDSGMIVGTGVINGRSHAFLLNPVPEPASLAVLALGGLAMFRRRKRGRGWFTG